MKKVVKERNDRGVVEIENREVFWSTERVYERKKKGKYSKKKNDRPDP